MQKTNKKQKKQKQNKTKKKQEFMMGVKQTNFTLSAL